VDEIQQSGRPERHLWRVGEDWVELAPAGPGWTARVQRGGWDGLALDLDGHFGCKVEALAWCERMARILAADLEEESGAPSPSA
jgi:hypothetical protein